MHYAGKLDLVVDLSRSSLLIISRCSSAILINAGQVCAATSRLYLHKDIATQVIESLKGIYRAAAEQMGPGDDPMSVPPVADEQQFRNILLYIESGKGTAELIAGGASKPLEGYWIEPTVFLEPVENAKGYKEEIFGPVLTIKVLNNEDDIIRWANDSEYGLAGESTHSPTFLRQKIDVDVNMNVSDSGGFHKGYRSRPSGCRQDPSRKCFHQQRPASQPSGAFWRSEAEWPRPRAGQVRS